MIQPGLALSDWLDPSSITSTDPARSQDLRTTVSFPAKGENHETQRTLPCMASDSISNNPRQEQLFPWNESSCECTPPPSALLCLITRPSRESSSRKDEFPTSPCGTGPVSCTPAYPPPYFRSPSRPVVFQWGPAQPRSRNITIWATGVIGSLCLAWQSLGVEHHIP